MDLGPQEQPILGPIIPVEIARGAVGLRAGRNLDVTHSSWKFATVTPVRAGHFRNGTNTCDFGL
eukprot:3981985-Pyramimonas_sp.AAC.1